MNRLLWIVPLCVILVVAAVCCLGHSWGSSSGAPVSEQAIDDAAKSKRWQALILDNERVYFGKVSSGGEGLVKLDKAYFIQQQAGKDGKAGDLKVQPISEELQQAESPMYINVSHVVMLENLPSESRVAQAIESLK
jgi:hypothetical protein